MKKALAWFLVLALTAGLAIGGTLAYLADTDEDVNVMTIGKVKIDQLEYEREDVETNGDDAVVREFRDHKPLYPTITGENFNWNTTDGVVDWEQIGKEDYSTGIWDPTKINNEVDKMVFVKNKGDYNAYVRSLFAFEANGYTVDQFKSLFHLNLNDTDWDWQWLSETVSIPNENGTTSTNYVVAVATYKKALEPGQLTEISLSQVALDSIADNADIAGFGDTYQILVKTQAIQADGFDDPAIALDEGFGAIAADNIPWENDYAYKGISIHTAVDYLNGDATGTAISNNVINVYVGFDHEYPEVVKNYEGVLVDVEQDTPAYAYYVPNDSDYDVYILSDQTIYAPNSSFQLFSNMGKLKTLNITNLDFSRTTDMRNLVASCPELTELDVTGWDVSRNTSLDRAFYCCKKLKTITGLGTWDTGNVTTTFGCFYECNALESVEGIGQWDMGNVTTMAHMFRGCKKLEVLDVSKWDVSSVKEFNSMFNFVPASVLDVSGWNMRSATHINHMFYGCNGLTEICMKDWYLPNLITTSHMFTDCNNIEVIDVSGWYTPSLVSMDGMFNDCWRLKRVDMSSFDTSNVKEFSQIFEYCSSLEEIVGMEKWDTRNGRTYEEMFQTCNSLKKIDFSSFNTFGLENSYYAMNNDTHEAFVRMFGGLTNLEMLIIGENFSFDGNGTVEPQYQFKAPSSTDVDGWDGHWYNLETGVAYLPEEIPEEVAATYVAVNPNRTPETNP